MKQSHGRRFLPDLGRETGNTTSMTLTNHCSRSCVSLLEEEKCLKEAFANFTSESEQAVILLVPAMEHVVRDVALDKNTVTCWTSGRVVVEHSRHNIAVLQLCYTTRLFIDPDGNKSGPTLGVCQPRPNRSVISLNSCSLIPAFVERHAAHHCLITVIV